MQVPSHNKKRNLLSLCIPSSAGAVAVRVTASTITRHVLTIITKNNSYVTSLLFMEPIGTETARTETARTKTGTESAPCHKRIRTGTEQAAGQAGGRVEAWAGWCGSDVDGERIGEKGEAEVSRVGIGAGRIRE